MITKTYAISTQSNVDSMILRVCENEKIIFLLFLDAYHLALGMVSVCLVHVELKTRNEAMRFIATINIDETTVTTAGRLK